MAKRADNSANLAWTFNLVEVKVKVKVFFDEVACVCSKSAFGEGIVAF